MVHATHKPEPHLSYQMAQTGKLKRMHLLHLVLCLAGSCTNMEHSEMHAKLWLSYAFCDAKWQHPNMMALHMLLLPGRKHIYFFTLIKGHRPNRGKQNRITEKLTTNLIPKTFWSKPDFSKSSWYQNYISWLDWRTKGLKKWTTVDIITEITRTFILITI